MLMVIFLLLLATLAPDGYLAAYSDEARETTRFFRENRTLFEKHFPGADADELALYFSIVAPEVSQYSAFRDYFEVRALKMKYVKDGSCNYSVGFFQMTPAFAEDLEKEVVKDIRLQRKYGNTFEYSSKSGKEIRRERINRLASVEWQVRYLALFVDFAKQRTAGWGLKNSDEKLRCWATLYNAGSYLNKARVEHRFKVKQFPRGTKEYNYSAVALEFYRMFTED